MPKLTRHPGITKLFLAFCLLILAGCGLMVDRVVVQALHPRKTICQVPPSSFVSAPKEISFTSKNDGLLLKGWYLEAPQAAKGTLVLAHGYRQNRLPAIPEAIELVNAALNAGYNLLLFDFRNCGESEGRMTTFGLLESFDLLAAVDYVESKAPQMPIYVLGFSMGAAAGVLAAAQTKSITALVVDSSFADLKQYFNQHLTTWTNLPRFPFTFLLMSAGPRSAGLDIASVSPLQAAGQVHQPVLVIHSRQDERVPLSEGVRLFAALAGTIKELWIVPDSEHASTFVRYPDQYQERILAFLEEVRSSQPSLPGSQPDS